MSELTIDYWQLFQKKGDKLLVLLGKPKKSEVKKVVKNYLFGISSLLIIAFIWIYTQIYVTSMGYTISQLQKERHDLENLQRILLIDESSLRSAERIEKIASQMGLTIPDKVDMVYVPISQNLPRDEKISKNPLSLLTTFFKCRKVEAFEGGEEVISY